MGHRLKLMAFFVGVIKGRAMARCGFVLALVGIALVSATGCARRAGRASLPSMAIPVSCASEITMMECDARVNPPKCKSVRVTYRRGCERILVRE